MKKIIACLLTMCTVLSFAACSTTKIETEQVPHITVQTTQATNEETTQAVTEPTEEFKPEPYDSNKLVWLTQFYEISAVARPRTAVIKEDYVAYDEYREIFELLKKNGVDKEIEFRKMLLPEGTDRACALEEIINSGEQVDIVEFDYKKPSSLMDLTDYFNTDKGKAIKAAVSENVWRGLGEPEGKHYFVPMKRALQGEQNGYVISKALMKKNGLTENDLKKGIGELTEVFEKVKSDGYSCYSLGFEMDSSIIYPRFVPVGSNNMPFLMIDADSKNGTVQNIYENAECIEQLKVISSWRKNKMFFESENEALLWDIYYSGKNYTDLNITPVGEAYADNNVRGRTLAISKTCRNADIAFDVIALTVTNDEILMKLNPFQANIVAPESDLKFYDAFGFYADFTPVQKEYDECCKIINARFESEANGKDLGNPWRGEPADVDAAMKELNAELKAAGLDKILAELNRQLDEFYSRQK